MQNKHYIICGYDTKVPKIATGEQIIRLWLRGPEGAEKLTLRIEDIEQHLYGNVPDKFLDLIEIATYVYCADQAIKRGQQDVEYFGENWRRDLHFIVPVRVPAFWKSREVIECLRETLGFLSDDWYEFDFKKIEGNYPLQSYLELCQDNSYLGNPERVVMFSGGLDSLGGAIEEIVNQKRNVALVTHKSTPKTNRRLHALQLALASKADENKPFNIGIRINKNKALNREYTQRSRSFLYASLGATIAAMLSLSGIRFYENGVISLNLPVCAQVVGARATRTTHPRVIQGFQNLFSLVAEKDFLVENPFIWKTKGEVVELIAKAGCAEMIGLSTSCTHTWEMTNQHTHCGKCSQCIDRRFSVLAMKQEANDPEAAYASALLTETRDKSEDKTMLATYVEKANRISEMSLREFMTEFGEANRVYRCFNETAGVVASKVFDLHKRHAKEIASVIDRALAEHASALRQRTLPGDCLLRIVYESSLPYVAPVIERQVDEPPNLFRRCGEAWEARFKGSERIVLNSVARGAEYIHYLLQHPNADMPVIEIVGRKGIALCNYVSPEDQTFAEMSDGFQITDGILLSDAGAIADHTAIAQYRQRSVDLLREIDCKRADGNAVEVQVLEEEIVQIAHAIEEAVGLGNRQRKAKDMRKNVRDAFRNAVNRAICKIDEYDSVLAEHLKQHIIFGSTARYAPTKEILWVLAPIKESHRTQP